MAANLFEFYQSQNKPLPSIQERGQIYQTAGLGSASTYSGTAQQNTSLLGYLQQPTYATNSPTSTAQYSQFLAPPSTYKPPAVMTSSAPTTINQGIGFLSNLTNLPQSNPSTGTISQPATGATGTAPKPPTGTSAPTGQTPPQGNPLAVTSPNQTLQNIVSQTNELLKNYSSMGGTFTPEMQKQISGINGLDATTQALTSQAQTALQNSQFESFNNLITQIKESQKTRDAEIQKLTSSLQPIRDQYLKSLLPSQGEQDLQMQLADLQKQQADFELSLEQGIESEQGIGRPMSLTTGRQAALQRQAQFGRQDLRNQENLLLNRLGIAQGNRELQAKIAEQGLAFAMEDRKFAQEVFDKQEERDNQTIDLFMKYNTLQRQEAADILDSLVGTDPSKLSPQALASLSQIAAQRGLDVRDLLSALEVQHDKVLMDKTLQEAQIAKTLRPDSNGTGGLTPAQINATINQIAGAFDNEPTVKEFNTINAYVNTFKNLGTSATDDQARIYAFAKVMDPAGSVKEGEYKTVQEYSQALLKRAGINVARIYTDSGTLSTEARNSMLTTLQTRLTAQESAYNQVRSEYQRQMDDAAAGRPRQLTNYQTPTSDTLIATPPDDQLQQEYQSLQGTSGGDWWSGLLKSFNIGGWSPF